MKKFILFMLLNSAVYADTTYLVIPAQYYSDNKPYQTKILEFKDIGQYAAEVQCQIASKAIHMVYPAPSYSLCTINKPHDWLWR